MEGLRIGLLPWCFAGHQMRQKCGYYKFILLSSISVCFLKLIRFCILTSKLFLTYTLCFKKYKTKVTLNFGSFSKTIKLNFVCAENNYTKFFLHRLVLIASVLICQQIEDFVMSVGVKYLKKCLITSWKKWEWKNWIFSSRKLARLHVRWVT